MSHRELALTGTLKKPPSGGFFICKTILIVNVTLFYYNNFITNLPTLNLDAHMFEDSSIQDQNQNEGKEKNYGLGEVIAKDCNGEYMVPGSLVLVVGNNGYSVEVIESSSQIDWRFDKCVGAVITEKNLTELVDELEVVLFPEDTWLNITRLENADTDYWSRIQQYAAELTKYKDAVELATRAPHSNESDLLEALAISMRETIAVPTDIIRFQVPEVQTTFAVTGYKSDAEGVTLEFISDTGYSYEYIIPTNEVICPYDDYKCALGIVEHGNERSLVFFKIKSANLKPFEPVFERMSSIEDVHRRLVQDFPWIQLADITKQINIPMFDTSTSENTLGELSMIDKKRFAKIYPKGRTLSDTQELNNYERMYLETRNYAYVAELGARLTFRSTDLAEFSSVDELIDSRLATMTVDERWEVVIKTLTEIEKNTRKLLSHRWKLEERLFGDQIVNPYQQYIQRFLGAGTINEFGDAVGLYVNGVLALQVELDESYTNYGLKALARDEQLTTEVRNFHIMQAVAEVVAHEIGHIGLRDTRYTGTALVVYKPQLRDAEKYEEVYTEWKSVHLPRALETPGLGGQLSHPYTYFSVLYNRSVTYNNGRTELGESYGGAHAIGEMVELLARHDEDIEIYGKTWRINRDFALKCALATAFARRETGVFEFMGQQVVGFKDLFNTVIKKNEKRYQSADYSTRLRGCEDVDYWRYAQEKEATAVENAQNTHQAEVTILSADRNNLIHTIQSQIYSKLKQKVATNIF